MPQNFSEFLSVVVDYAWGLPLVFLLMGGGAILFIFARMLPIFGFSHAIRLVSGKFEHIDEDQASGQISHFQALSNALAATIGLGNIAGVAVAINQGGPGSIFWMWVAAIVGMNTKFFECTLSLMYRDKDYAGEVQGGPMYVIQNAMPSWCKPLAYAFAIFGLVGTMALFQVNQLSSFVEQSLSVPPLVTGAFCALFVGIVLKGGIQRLAHATSSMVPAMCLIYVLASLVIIILNIDKVPVVFTEIFRQAFSGGALFGGAQGMAVAAIMKIGIKRAAFSNEAGIGTAPMAHSNAKTSEPISEGYVAMLGPFLDTIVVCTMTALVILTSVDLTTVPDEMEGILLTNQAFTSTLGTAGSIFLGIAILLFSLTTMLGMANYNQKCWDFIFRGHRAFRRPTFIAAYSATLLFGSISAMDDVVNILDIGFALMAVPNMIATLYLAPKVMRALNDYRKKYFAPKGLESESVSRSANESKLLNIT